MLRDVEVVSDLVEHLEVVEAQLAWWTLALVMREHRREQLLYCLQMC